jgi:HPt (histidine-containing phosphotransfer) domain-containing protein
MVDLLLNAAATATVASGHPLLDIRVALAWVGNDPRQLQPLLRSFVSELPGFIGSMDTLVAHPGYDEIGRLAHRMKSSLEIVGAPSARARVEALQKAAESDNREQVERIWKTLKLDCLNLSCLMEEMLEIIAPPHRRRSYAPIASG